MKNVLTSSALYTCATAKYQLIEYHNKILPQICTIFGQMLVALYNRLLSVVEIIVISCQQLHYPLLQVCMFHLMGQSQMGNVVTLFSLLFPSLSAHTVDQIGSVPITCQWNVPALLSINSWPRTGLTAAFCRPLVAIRTAVAHWCIGSAQHTSCMCSQVCSCCKVYINIQVHTHACLRGINAASGSITTQHVLPCSAAYVMSAVQTGRSSVFTTNLRERVGFGMCQQAYL